MKFVITAIGYVAVPFLIVLPPVALVLALSLIFTALHDLRKEQVREDAEVFAAKLADKIAEQAPHGEKNAPREGGYRAA